MGIHLSFGKFLTKHAADMKSIAGALATLTRALPIDHGDKASIGKTIVHISTIGDRVATTAAELIEHKGVTIDPVAAGSVALADVVAAVLSHQSFKDALKTTVQDVVATVAVDAASAAVDTAAGGATPAAAPVDAGKAPATGAAKRG
jgi:hypothetical protein